MKVFLTCEIFFDFFKHVCKKYYESFCMVQNYFKVFNMCAKIVVISYLVKMLCSFSQISKLIQLFYYLTIKLFLKIFTNCKISLIFENKFYKFLNKILPMQFFKQIFQISYFFVPISLTKNY